MSIGNNVLQSITKSGAATRPPLGAEQIQITSQGTAVSRLRRKRSKTTMLGDCISYFLLVLKITCILN